MQPIRTDRSNFVYRGPREEIMDLPCERKVEDIGGPSPVMVVYSVWEPDEEDRARIGAGGNIKLGIVGIEPIPPVILGVTGETDIMSTYADG